MTPPSPDRVGFHVVCRRPDRLPWVVTRHGDLVAACPTRDKAVCVARALARERGLSVRIHGVNGRIREERSYGNETRRPG